MTGLTRFQADIARLFFSLPSSAGFVLGGGAALLASGITSRPTRDLDFFCSGSNADVLLAYLELTDVLARRGVATVPVRVTPSFIRLHITGPEELIIDLCIDVEPLLPPVALPIGPAFDLEELAGRKLLALYSRAEARDFIDVFVIAQQIDRRVVMTRAAEIDRGLQPEALSAMLRSIDRLGDSELQLAQWPAAAMRSFFHEWADELERIRKEWP